MEGDPSGFMGPGSADYGMELARAYYESLDAGDYDRLEGLLAPDFIHERPDQTLEGRDTFVQFMRSGRPSTNTTHPIDAIYRQPQGPDVAVQGRLCRADGSVIATFVDVFEVGKGRLQSLTTYTA